MRLALKNRRWRGCEIRIASAHSAAEARVMLRNQPDMFHVAMIDGVMETNSAGLDLCREISEERRSLPVIFHSGIFSRERQVRATYGSIFDVFLPKAEVTAALLYEAITRCLSPGTRGTRDVVAA